MSRAEHGLYGSAFNRKSIDNRAKLLLKARQADGGPVCICSDGWVNAGCKRCRPVRSMAGFESAEEQIRAEMVR